MKTTRNLLLLFLVLNTQSAFCQLDSICPGILNSADGYISASGYKITFTIGDIAVNTIHNQIYLTQGFQQSTIGKCDTSFLEDVSIFPNPFKDYAYALFDVKSKSSFRVEIFNLKGSLMSINEYKGLFYGERITLETGQLSRGIYFVNVTSLDGSLFRKYKIIKI